PPGWRNLPTVAAPWAFDGPDGAVEVALPPDDDVLEVSATSATCVVGGLRRHLRIDVDDDVIWANTGDWQVRLTARPRFRQPGADTLGGGPRSPLPGTVIAIEVVAGQQVATDDVLVVVEAMKMEHRVLAGADGVVTEVVVRVGDRVDANQLLATIEPFS